PPRPPRPSPRPGPAGGAPRRRPAAGGAPRGPRPRPGAWAAGARPRARRGCGGGAPGRAPSCCCGAPPGPRQPPVVRRPAPGDRSPRVASSAGQRTTTPEGRLLVELVLDPQELVVLGDAVAAGGRTGLDLPAVGGDGEVGDGRVLRLAGAVRHDAGVG